MTRRTRCALGATLAVALAACAGPESGEQHQQQPMRLTFSVRVATKLFINTIPILDCDPASVVGFAPWAVAPYMVFCGLTSLGENPASDANVNPLDARILGAATITWECVAGDPAPHNVQIASGGSAGGPEGPLVGIANPMAVAAPSATGAHWGMVTSGHPNPLAEPGFQALRLRANVDIWNRITGTITCGTDPMGRPTASTNYRITHTRFPSHKVWRRSPAGAAAPQLLFNRAQGVLSNLWFLPAIPNP